MIIGYTEKVNKIVVIQKDKHKFARKLGIYGLNICGNNYTYYDTNIRLHILDTNYISEIKCYNNNLYVGSITI